MNQAQEPCIAAARNALAKLIAEVRMRGAALDGTLGDRCCSQRAIDGEHAAYCLLRPHRKLGEP